MIRVTKYDSMRKCYVVLPDAPQGSIIQRLGLYEDRDEATMPMSAGDGGKIIRCISCNGIIPVENEKLYSFCPWCGQRLLPDNEEEEDVQ